MKRVFTIINRNFVYRDKAQMNCHYCGNPFAVVKKRINLTLFACDKCKTGNKKVDLTQLNEHIF